MEHDDVGGVDEGHAEVLGHEVGREPLAAGDDVLGRVLLDVVREGLELVRERPFEAELIDDVLVTALDIAKKGGAVDAVLDVGVHKQEKVRDLVVPGETLAGGGDDDELAVRIGLDDALDLLELLGGSDGGAAKLCDLDHL